MNYSGKFAGLNSILHLNNFPKLVEFIKAGKYASLDVIPDFRDSDYEKIIKKHRKRYKNNDFPLFDVVGVTTLFTFYWKQTIDTINYAKKFCKPNGKMLVGDIASAILPDYILAETGVNTLEQKIHLCCVGDLANE